MPDLSAIPFGPGVSQFSGIVPNMNILYDPNQAVYKIESSSGEWSLLFIRAKSEGLGWAFTLESAPVDDVAKVFGPPGNPDYDPPRVVDYTGNAISQADNECPPALVAFADIDPPKTEFNVPYTVDAVDYNLTLETTSKFRQHIVEEIGTYVMPIAYHRVTPAGLDVRQVARSDWSFWPMPRHAVWHRDEVVTKFELTAVCGGPP